MIPQRSWRRARAAAAAVAVLASLAVVPVPVSEATPDPDRDPAIRCGDATATFVERGTMIGDDDYCLHVFESDGSWTAPDGITEFDLIAVGGGGGGGGGAGGGSTLVWSNLAGGGGGGGGGLVLLVEDVPVTSGAVTFTLGSGGAGGTGATGNTGADRDTATDGQAGTATTVTYGSDIYTAAGGGGGGAGRYWEPANFPGLTRPTDAGLAQGGSGGGIPPASQAGSGAGGRYVPDAQRNAGVGPNTNDLLRVPRRSDYADVLMTFSGGGGAGSSRGGTVGGWAAGGTAGTGWELVGGGAVNISGGNGANDFGDAAVAGVRGGGGGGGAGTGTLGDPRDSSSIGGAGGPGLVIIGYAAFPLAATVPGPPTAVSATAGDGQASVSWTAPASAGGSAITKYTVTASPEVGGVARTCEANAPATTCVVTGLTNGTAYTFTVVATNDVGDSDPSNASTAVTPVGAPDAPVNVRVSSGPPLQVLESGTVRWASSGIRLPSTAAVLSRGTRSPHRQMWTGSRGPVCPTSPSAFLRRRCAP